MVRPNEGGLPYLPSTGIFLPLQARNGRGIRRPPTISALNWHLLGESAAPGNTPGQLLGVAIDARAK